MKRFNELSWRVRLVIVLAAGLILYWGVSLVLLYGGDGGSQTPSEQIYP